MPFLNHLEVLSVCVLSAIAYAELARERGGLVLHLVQGYAQVFRKFGQ
jgi:hypothetical protein